ncbi:unnamed protein product, partial [Nesidiocoris tenuis]
NCVKRPRRLSKRSKPTSSALSSYSEHHDASKIVLERSKSQSNPASKHARKIRKSKSATGGQKIGEGKMVVNMASQIVQRTFFTIAEPLLTISKPQNALRTVVPNLMKADYTIVKPAFGPPPSTNPYGALNDKEITTRGYFGDIKNHPGVTGGGYSVKKVKSQPLLKSPSLVSATMNQSDKENWLSEKGHNFAEASSEFRSSTPKLMPTTSVAQHEGEIGEEEGRPSSFADSSSGSGCLINSFLQKSFEVNDECESYSVGNTVPTHRQMLINESKRIASSLIGLVSDDARSDMFKEKMIKVMKRDLLSPVRACDSDFNERDSGKPDQVLHSLECGAGLDKKSTDFTIQANSTTATQRENSAPRCGSSNALADDQNKDLSIVNAKKSGLSPEQKFLIENSTLPGLQQNVKPPCSETTDNAERKAPQGTLKTPIKSGKALGDVAYELKIGQSSKLQDLQSSQPNNKDESIKSQTSNPSDSHLLRPVSLPNSLKDKRPDCNANASFPQNSPSVTVTDEDRIRQSSSNTVRGSNEAVDNSIEKPSKIVKSPDSSITIRVPRSAMKQFDTLSMPQPPAMANASSQNFGPSVKSLALSTKNSGPPIDSCAPLIQNSAPSTKNSEQSIKDSAPSINNLAPLPKDCLKKESMPIVSPSVSKYPDDSSGESKPRSLKPEIEHSGREGQKSLLLENGKTLDLVGASSDTKTESHCSSQQSAAVSKTTSDSRPPLKPLNTVCKELQRTPEKGLHSPRNFEGSSPTSNAQFPKNLSSELPKSRIPSLTINRHKMPADASIIIKLPKRAIRRTDSDVSSETQLSPTENLEHSVKLPSAAPLSQDSARCNSENIRSSVNDNAGELRQQGSKQEMKSGREVSQTTSGGSIIVKLPKQAVNRVNNTPPALSGSSASIIKTKSAGTGTSDDVSSTLEGMAPVPRAVEVQSPFDSSSRCTQNGRSGPPGVTSTAHNQTRIDGISRQSLQQDSGKQEAPSNSIIVRLPKEAVLRVNNKPSSASLGNGASITKTESPSANSGEPRSVSSTLVGTVPAPKPSNDISSSSMRYGSPGSLAGLQGTLDMSCTLPTPSGAPSAHAQTHIVAFGRQRFPETPIGRASTNEELLSNNISAPVADESARSTVEASQKHSTPASKPADEILDGHGSLNLKKSTESGDNCSILDKMSAAASQDSAPNVRTNSIVGSDETYLPLMSSAVKVSVDADTQYVPWMLPCSNVASFYFDVVQSDDYSGDESSEEENSATEISTDSEFEHDGTTHTIPDIVISETVQVKRGNLESPKQVQFVQRQLNGRYENAKSRNNDLRLELNRIEPQAPINTTNNKAKPLLNPNRGDYLLNRTQSTEGIASKISLELKKKYLLGPQGLSGNVRKSGSTSTLDTKFKSLIDQISEQQKLLNPAPVPSPTMQAFLQGADRLKLSPLQLLEKKTLPTEDFKHVCSLKEKDEVKEEKKEEEEVRPRSPVHETSIVVPDFPRNDTKEVESDSLSSELSSSTEDTADEEEEEEGDDVAEAVEEKANNEEPQIQTPPKLEIHNSRGELMEDTPEMDSLNMPDICQAENEKSPIDKLDLVPLEFKKVITVPDQVGGAVLTQVTNTEDLYFNEKRTETPDSSDSLKNDLTAHTETEMSDWARDEDGVSEPLDDLEFADKPEHRRLSGPRGIAKTAKPEDFDEYTHVCGKETPVAHNALNLDNLEFMDTGDESSEASSDHHLNLNRGYVQFINNDEDLTPVVEYVNPLKEELTDTTTTSEPTTVKDSPAEGLKTVTESIVTPEVIELAATAPGKVPYGTVRDSIVVMKRNHLKEAAAAVAAVAAAAASVIEPKGNALNSPATTRKLEQLSQERAKQKDLIHEMVMNKLIAQGKSPTERIDRKKRLSRNFSPVPHAVPPSVVEPKPIIEQEKAPMKFVENNENVDVSNRMTPRTRSYTVGSVSSSARRRKEAVSLPNIHAAAGTETPLGAGTPLDLRSGLREQARAKFKMMSNEQLGLSPEDKLKRYKLKIQKQLKDETPKSSRNDSRYDILKKSPEDRKKSIIQAVSDFFHKKSPSSPKTPSSHYDSKNLTLTFINKKVLGTTLNNLCNFEFFILVPCGRAIIRTRYEDNGTIVSPNFFYTKSQLKDRSK